MWKNKKIKNLERRLDNIISKNIILAELIHDNMKRIKELENKIK